jgi:AraC-like DNA-binding protein
VKTIWVFENEDKNIQTNLPFFADGYPGLMFQQTDNGLKVKPHNKKMPALFLYGQTIKPITLDIKGSYTLVIFQLYPFVLKSLFNVIPQSINDNCYYLDDAMGTDVNAFTNQLLTYKNVQQKINAITELLLSFFDKKKQTLDYKIKQAIESIIQTKGQENISSISEKLKLNIRTFERRFLNETGLKPKQFAKIIQFQASLEQLTVEDFTKLTDIVYQNGFSDQSHFIRVFKAFTGKTPRAFKK